MRGRTLLARVFAIVLAATLVGSLLASCLEGARSTPTEQMACCKQGHNTCPMRGTPGDCCTSTPHFSQFTAVEKFSSPPPHLFTIPVFDALLIAAAPAWTPGPTAYAPSPPGSKHPIYLVFSDLRI